MKTFRGPLTVLVGTFMFVGYVVAETPKHPLELEQSAAYTIAAPLVDLVD